MNISRVICLSAAVLLPHLAQAGTQLSHQQLGAGEAVVDSCSRISARDKDRFEQIDRRLTQGLTQKQLDETRRSSDYKSAYGSVITAVNGMPGNDARDACNVAANENLDCCQSPAPHGDKDDAHRGKDDSHDKKDDSHRDRDDR
jgi:hypothetical protein